MMAKNPPQSGPFRLFYHPASSASMRVSVAAELAECSAGDQMALDVEEVVDGRMDGEEPLRGRGRFEPLHLSLSSSHRLM